MVITSCERCLHPKPRLEMVRDHLFKIIDVQAGVWESHHSHPKCCVRVIKFKPCS